MAGITGGDSLARDAGRGHAVGMRSLPPALKWLYSVQQFGIKPGLENIRRLMKELQLPAPHQRFFHVAGTNGKGSTCAFMEGVLRAAGERTGLFTSPHLVSFTERIRTGGEMIPLETVEQGIAALRTLVGDWNPHPTFFELALALALDWFDRCGAESIVLETGMGGRWDATNALTPVVSVITPVSMDHEQWLGDSIEKIAAEKAGIIKPGVPVVSAPQVPAAENVLRAAAERAGAPIAFIDQPRDEELPLPGTHQKWNAALAVAALNAAGFRLTADAIQQGLAGIEWPARFQRLDGARIVIDGAHNPHGIAALVETWRQFYGAEKATIVFGAAAAKDYPQMLTLLAPLAARFFMVTLASPRAVPAAELVAAAGHGIAFPDAASAVAAAIEFPERALVCGSLYLCGEVLALREQQTFEVSSQ